MNKEPITRKEMFLADILDAAENGGGGGAEVIPLYVSQNGTYTAEEGTAYSPVDVDIQPALGIGEFQENGTYQAASHGGIDGWSEVTVSVAPHTASKVITSNGNYDAASEGLDGYSIVSVEVPSSATFGTKSITSNGTYNASSDGYDGYSSVTVNVSGGGGSPTQFASSGTIASPSSTVSSGSLLAMAFASHKYNEVSFDFGGNTYVMPCTINQDSTVIAGLSGVNNGVVTIGFIKWNIQNLTLVYDSMFFGQVNTDGTGFVDMTAYIPTSTAATINGYYWS